MTVTAAALRTVTSLSEAAGARPWPGPAAPAAAAAGPISLRLPPAATAAARGGPADAGTESEVAAGPGVTVSVGHESEWRCVSVKVSFD